jgi:DNA-binding PadR family transcriptional regulator
VNNITLYHDVQLGGTCGGGSFRDYGVQERTSPAKAQQHVIISYLVEVVYIREKSSMHQQLSTGEEDHSSRNNTLRSIILGLLWARPMSGYDIKQTFDRAIACYWNAGTSQIYTMLKHLHKAGLVEVELIVQTTRPNRKVYRLTEAGNAEIAHWLEEEVPERFTKDEFLTKLFFCGETTDEVALEHLHGHRENLLKQLAHMEWARKEYGSRPTRRPRLLEYQMLVREYKEAVLKAGLEVTERAIARIEERLNM